MRHLLILEPHAGDGSCFLAGESLGYEAIDIVGTLGKGSPIGVFQPH